MLNDGSDTRQYPASEHITATVITILDQNLRVAEEWRVQRAVNFDHFPLLVALELTVQRKTKPSRLVWTWKDADCLRFREAVEEETNQFEKLLMRSAKKFVRMKKVGRIGQIWHNRDIDTAIVKRNELVDHRHAKPEEHRAAAQRVESLIAEKKREIWRDKVFKNKDAKQMWSLFHKLPRSRWPDRSDP